VNDKILGFSPNSEKTNCEYQIRSYYTGILRYARTCVIRRTWKKNVLKAITTFLSVSCTSLEKLSAQPIKSKAVWRVIKRNRPFIKVFSFAKFRSSEKLNQEWRTSLCKIKSRQFAQDKTSCLYHSCLYHSEGSFALKSETTKYLVFSPKFRENKLRVSD